MAKSKSPAQHALFGADLTCPDIEGLPLITDPAGNIEVLAPGSVYQPLLLKPLQKNIDVGPGTLDDSEEKFVRDLINVLYPAGDPPRSPKTPMEWNGKQLWIKRNIEKNPNSLRLRIDESDWYYPDFVIWIVDTEKCIQTIGFVDPKGLTMGIKGWGDYKMLSTLYMPHVLAQKKLSQTMIDGQMWEVRIRGIMLSNTKLKDLVSQEKMYAHDHSGDLKPLNEEQFNRARIVFQEEKTDYIRKILSLLEQDNDLDDLLLTSAKIFYGNSETPSKEQDYDLLIRYAEHEGSESEFVTSILRHYLLPDQNNTYGSASIEKRRGQLVKYAKSGKFGLGSEKAQTIAEHPTPCKELWERMNKKHN